MVDIAPGAAFLLALKNAFDAARANAPRGNTGVGIPGISDAADQGTPSLPGQVAGSSIGGLGGGVPGTAPTGQNALVPALGGGEPAGTLTPLPLRQPDTVNALNFGPRQNVREPGERGDQGAGVTGGNLNMLLAVLSGNPLAMGLAASRAVAGQDRETGGAILSDGRRVPAQDRTVAPGTLTGRDVVGNIRVGNDRGGSSREADRGVRVGARGGRVNTIRR